MDITQALKDAENSLRDFINAIMTESAGDEWVDNCGISAERLEKWKQRKRDEPKRLPAGTAEERLIYYADFYDLKTIIKKNWSGIFSDVFGDFKTIEVHLTELEKLRDPDAHRRELLPHQRALAIGISGEIRNRIIRYRSKKETMHDCFPRLESVRDSLGNIWVPSSGINNSCLFTNMVLRPGYCIEFVITATDPLGSDIEYAICTGIGPEKWQSDSTFTFIIEQKHVSKNLGISFYIRAHRNRELQTSWDDEVRFFYTVLPSN